MKNIFKIMPLALAFVAIVGFAGCGGSNLANVNFADAEPISAQEVVDYVGTEGVESSMTGYTATAKFNGKKIGEFQFQIVDAQTGDFDLKYEMTMPKEMIGPQATEDMEINIYVTDGYLFMEAMGQKIKMSLDSAGAEDNLSYVETFTSLANIGDLLSSLTSQSQDGMEIRRLVDGETTMFEVKIASDYYEDTIFRVSFENGIVNEIYENVESEGKSMEVLIKASTRAVSFPNLNSYVDIAEIA